MYDIVRYRVRYPYDIGRKIVRLFALIVRYLYVIAPYIGRTSAVHRSYIALVRCTLHLPPEPTHWLDLNRHVPALRHNLNHHHLARTPRCPDTGGLIV